MQTLAIHSINMQLSPIVYHSVAKFVNSNVKKKTDGNGIWWRTRHPQDNQCTFPL